MVATSLLSFMLKKGGSCLIYKGVSCDEGLSCARRTIWSWLAIWKPGGFAITRYLTHVSATDVSDGACGRDDEPRACVCACVVACVLCCKKRKRSLVALVASGDDLAPVDLLPATMLQIPYLLEGKNAYLMIMLWTWDR